MIDVMSWDFKICCISTYHRVVCDLPRWKDFTKENKLFLDPMHLKLLEVVERVMKQILTFKRIFFILC